MKKEPEKITWRLVPESSKQCRSLKTRTGEQVLANSNKKYPVYGNLKFAIDLMLS